MKRVKMEIVARRRIDNLQLKYSYLGLDLLNPVFEMVKSDFLRSLRENGVDFEDCSSVEIRMTTFIESEEE